MTVDPMNLPNPLPPNGLTALFSLSSLLRRRLMALAKRNLATVQFLEAAKKVIASFERMFHWLYRDSWLFGWLRAARRIINKSQIPTLANLPPLPPDTALFAPILPDAPLIRWPQIEAAANDLMRRELVTATQFAKLDGIAQQQAFTVARVQSVSTLRVVQDAVIQQVQHGGTLKTFRHDLDGRLDGILSQPQQECLYRDKVGVAYATGQKFILNIPIVSSGFPYALYTAVHDSRTEDTHFALEKLGIGGTAVYRRNDPVIQEFWAPWRWRCRCHCIPLSVEDAARWGCPEAIEWLRTGVEPQPAAFVAHPPFAPDPAWLAEYPTSSILL